MREFAKYLNVLVVVLVCAGLFPLAASAHNVLVLSTGLPALDERFQTLLRAHGHVVTIGRSFSTFSGEGLAGQDVVLLLPNHNWAAGDMPLAGQSALVDFIKAGGGLVTSEWTVWMSAFRSFGTLAQVFSVLPDQGYGESTLITYRAVTPDRILNDGLPASMTFPVDYIEGTETTFIPRPEATVFYSSTGDAGGAGVVGWRVGSGRVIQFSTLLGEVELGDSVLSHLVANAVTWAGFRQTIAEMSFEPAIVRTGSSSLAKFSGRNITNDTWLDIRFRVPGSATDQVVLNWQQGASAFHSVPPGSASGVWMVTGARAHESKDDHAGDFSDIATNLSVIRGPSANGMRFEPATVVGGGSSVARFTGTDLTDNTFFDVRFRAPGSTTDEVVLNWQRGTAENHVIPLGPGMWTVTGIRAHEEKDEHAGDFVTAATSLAVIQTSCFVTTAAGDFQGVDLGASCAFLGIPYAAPPVGSLRWKPPQPSPRLSSVLFATSPSANCAAINQAGQPAGSEDCLRLNIWLPKPISTTQAPVFVWIHTGSFVAASANFAGSDGQKMAEQKGVVVVAPNYRLGPFGFLAHSELTAEDSAYRSSGNYGFLDQRAALIWVRDNIAKFGGDPNLVTIGGQSAGAHSVSLHVVSPGSAGLFHRAVMESGYASTRWRTREEAESQGNSLATTLGCTNPSQVLSCMRSKSRDDVLRALPVGRDEFSETLNVRWSPVVDGLEIPDQPRQLYEKAAFNRVPMLIGATREEGWLFVDRSFPAGLSALQYQTAVETEFGAAAADLLSKYRVQDFASPKEALSQLTGDAEYVCEAIRVARLVQQTGTPAYLYSFDYVVDGLASNRIIHGLDTNFVFGNNFVAPNPGNHILGLADQTLSRSMMGYWARFAATGDPNDRTDTSVATWPAFRDSIAPGIEAGKYLILDSVIREDKQLRAQQCNLLNSFFFRSAVGAVPASKP